MRTALIIICLFLTFTYCEAQTGFNKIFSDVVCSDAVISPDSGYVLCGQNYWGEPYVAKIDSAGNLVWDYSFGISFSMFYCLTLTHDSCYVLVGNDFIIKLNSNGDTLWSKLFGVPFTSTVYDIHETFDFGFIFYDNTFLYKIDSAGNIQWTKIFHNSNSAIRFNGVKQAPDSGFYVYGDIGSGPPNIIRGLLIKTNSTGDNLWSKVYSKQNAHIIIDDIEFTNDSLLILSRNGLNFSYNISKADTSGVISWSKGSDARFYFSPNRIIKINESKFIITSIEYWTSAFIQIDSLGNQQMGLFHGMPKAEILPLKNGKFFVLINNDASTEMAMVNSDYSSACFWTQPMNPLPIDSLSIDTLNLTALTGTIGIPTQPFTISAPGNILYDLCLQLSTNKISDESIKIFPNPATNKIHIELSENDIPEKISIVSMLGKEIISYNKFFENKITLDLNLKPGIYFLKIKSKNQSTTRRMVVQ